MGSAQFSRLSVLVAEPSAYTISLISSMLRAIGPRDIVPVSDSRALAVELARRPFDVVMLDDSLAGPGADLVRRLRTRPGEPNRQAAIIMMSATPDAGAIAAARDAGVTEFLRKPFAANHLETRLVSILAAPRAFIEAGAYAGPDRRRRSTNFEGSDRRESD